MQISSKRSHKLTKHHRKPKARGGKTKIKSTGSKKISNISVVPSKQHTAFHSCFNVLTPLGIACLLNKRFCVDKWSKWHFVAIQPQYDDRTEVEKSRSDWVWHSRKKTWESAFAVLFGYNPTPLEIARKLTQTWIDPGWRIEARNKMH